MPTIIRHLPDSRRSAGASTRSKSELRSPNYDCREKIDALTLVVYVPGTTASGIEITAHGPDLKVLARKARYVRPNWTALHLEKVSRDYELNLRLGYGLDYANLSADLADGILTITLPKLAAESALDRMPRAA